LCFFETLPSGQEKLLLFHCGPVPPSLMQEKGHVVDHPMLKKSLGPGCSWGPNQGRIKAMPMTYASAKTEDGKIWLYGGDGRFTEDVIPTEYFGCAGVAEIPDLEAKLNIIGKTGYRHHVSVAPGHRYAALREGLGNYLGYSWTDLD
jgi:L-fucose isomerase-like protein